MESRIKIEAETERLRLRRWKRDDLHRFAAMNRDAQVMKYFPALLTDSETEAFYDRIQEEFERSDQPYESKEGEKAKENIC